MELLKEFTNKEYNVISTAPKVYCKSFEDNSGTLEIVCLLKMQPHAKAINVIYHHIHKHVYHGIIAIFLIATNSQLADIFFKPLTKNTFDHSQK